MRHVKRHVLRLCGLLRPFIKRRDGNVTIMFAVAAVPMLLGLGAGIDYGLAMKRQSRMNSAADAAALAAVTPAMMKQSSAIAKLAATRLFNTQVTSMTGTNYGSDVSVQVNDVPGTGTVTRTVTVSYRASSTNNFARILAVPTLALKGTSTASASTSPNIDFYLMLDTSPSMAIAATQTGINTMVAATQSQGGCAFACHQTNPAADNLGNPGGEDNYALARNLGVTLRIDMVQLAVQNLMSTATNTSTSTGAAYRMAGYTFDVSAKNIFTLTSNLTYAASQASNIALLTVYSNGYITQGNNNNDQDTNFDSAFSTLNSAMPAPGQGTNQAGDSPQEVLFLVTDGVADANGGNGRAYNPFGPTTTNNGNGVPVATWCTNIKARGIRIAILYTTYNPLPTNWFYNTYIAPEQSQIWPAAQACASPGLATQVDTGADISGAMATLFSKAVSSARLTY